MSKFLDTAGLGALRDWVLQKLGLKQDTLVSGTNIKTINEGSILGSGNINADNIFIAEMNVTTYEEMLAAINSNKIVICDYETTAFYVIDSYIGSTNNNLYLVAIGVSKEASRLSKVTKYVLEINSENTWSGEELHNFITSTDIDVRDGTIVLTSPNGTQYKITVDNNGQLVTTAI